MNHDSVDIHSVATRLIGSRPTHLGPARTGSNSKVYRVESNGVTYALKQYPNVDPQDPRDRANTERLALQYLRARGITCIPRWLGGEPGIGLLEWIDGEPVIHPDEAEARAAIEFISGVGALSEDPAAREMPLASEACLSGAELIRQIVGRLERLQQVARTDPALEHFLNDMLVPELKRRERAARDAYAEAGLDFTALLTQDRRRLIPADFGFHNALRTPTALVFLDFEYFGWDDPAKLAADLLLHPGTSLREEIRGILEAGMRTCFGDEPGFQVRFEALFPCFALRWSLILLNPFLPEYSRARGIAQSDVLRAEQLAKAQAMVRRSNSLSNG